MAKDEAQVRRLEVVLYNLVDGLRLMSLMLSPFIPRAAQELWRRLGQEGEVAARDFNDDLKWGLTARDTKVELGDPLFPRIEDEPAAS